MSIRINNLLKIKEFNNSNVIAGFGGLNNIVTSITVAEVPDAALWLKSGELVLTTGYFISKNEDIQREWIDSLINHGASALAIKTDRFLVKLSQSTIELANDRNFPIIELPSGIIWPTLIEGVMNEISDYQQRIIDTTYKIHNELTTAVIAGSGIKHISDTISRLVSNTIIVEDILLNTLAISHFSCEDTEKVNNLIELLKSEQYKNDIRESIYYENLSSCVEFDANAIKGFKKIIQLGGYRKITLPIIAECQTLGFVSLIETEKESRDLDLIALEHGSTVIALELMREQILSNKTLKEKKSFLNYLLGVKNSFNDNVYFRNKYSFTFSKPVAVINIELKVHRMNSDCKIIFSNKIDMMIIKILKNILYQYDPECFFVSDSGTIELLIHFDNKDSKNIVIGRIKKICDQFIKAIEAELGELDYNIGVSGIHKELNVLKQSYEESKKAAEIGKVFQGENQIHFYDDQGFYKILFLLDNKEVISEYCNGIIGPLIQIDLKNNSDNCILLKSYIFNDSNIVKTAAANYMHSNTLAYRLKKIEEVLGIDLKDVKDKFNVYLAFILQELLQKEEA